MKKYTSNQLLNWEKAVEKYNSVMRDNAITKVTLMSEDDRQKFSNIHNLPTSNVEDVIDYVFKWSGFKSIVLSGLESNLFDRLLSGADPLKFPPPSNDKHPWYELFDYPDTIFECKVAYAGLGKRNSDKQKDTIVLSINDCFWSCSGGNFLARKIIDINHQWANDPNNISKHQHLWAEFLAVSAEGKILFDINFGQWKDKFQLLLEEKQDNQENNEKCSPQNLTEINLENNLFSEIEKRQETKWLLRSKNTELHIRL